MAAGGGNEAKKGSQSGARCLMFVLLENNREELWYFVGRQSPQKKPFGFFLSLSKKRINRVVKEKMETWMCCFFILSLSCRQSEEKSSQFRFVCQPKLKRIFFI